MSYLSTSRKGIYIDFKTKIREGKFFGLTHQGDTWYAFGHSADDCHVPDFKGYIIKFKIDDISNAEIIAEGLDNGGHQMCIYKNHLYVLETYVQRITKINLSDPTQQEQIFPIKKAIYSWYSRNGMEGSFKDYVHMNAITVQDDRFYLSCPHLKNKIINGLPSQTKHPTYILMFSSDWRLLDTFDTGRYFCHDLVLIGHEMYFSDASNIVCKLNIVTRRVEEVWNIEPYSPEYRVICRGLSISRDGDAWVGAHDKYGNAEAVNPKTKERIKVEDLICCTKRIDGTDYNDETSSLKQPCVTTVVAPTEIISTVVQVHRKNERKGSILPDDELKSLLNPTLDTGSDLPNPKNDVIGIENTFISLPENFADSSPFFLYPQGHYRNWHTNKGQVESDKDNLVYRLYAISTSEDSYFLYKHPISSKIHAIKDIDGSGIVFRLVQEGSPFWHAVLCKTGSRMSFGIKFNRETMLSLGIDNIWKDEITTFNLSIKNDLFNENSIIPHKIGAFQDLPIRVVGKRVSLSISETLSEFYLKLIKVIQRYNNDFYKFNLNCLHKHIQYSEYSQGDFQAPVINMGDCKKLVVIIQTGEYEGGELIINTHRGAETFKGNVIFPSYLAYEVTPVTKGTLKQITAWAEGPAFM
jgi:hypothetical protein